MKIKALTDYLESIAPPVYQESYDNAGLIIGDPDTELKGILICLDAIEAVVDEAIALGFNMIVAHHPIIFKGLKSLNGKNYVERVVMKAVKHDIAIYAIHTNLDNVFRKGVNAKIAEKLNLQQTRILAPKQTLKSLVAFPQAEYAEALKQALFETGVEKINSFALDEEDQALNRLRIEMIFPAALKSAVIRAMNSVSPADVPFKMYSVENHDENTGSGMIGELAEPMNEQSFLHFLKQSMKTQVVRHTNLLGKPIKKIALCGGAGGFLLGNAIAQQADIFITADYKYHEFFDADGKIIIADIGHFESEQFTIELLHDIIINKFSNFAARCTKVNTNPVNYF